MVVVIQVIGVRSLTHIGFIGGHVLFIVGSLTMMVVTLIGSDRGTLDWLPAMIIVLLLLLLWHLSKKLGRLIGGHALFIVGSLTMMVISLIGGDCELLLLLYSFSLVTLRYAVMIIFMLSLLLFSLC